MPHEQLLSRLTQLHDMLQNENAPVAETRVLLETVASDIQTALNSQAGATESKSLESLSEQFRVALLEFEARHPHLSGLAERITAGLAGMGI